MFLKRSIFRNLVASSVVAGIAITVAAQNPELPPPPASGGDAAAPTGDQDVESEILTRGPVHEAFAEQYVSDPQPGLIVEQAPPEPIDELPPEEMPEGDNVEWIPGYWAFDEDLDDFIWISGFWRDIPLGQRWVPGYWNEVPEGFQWVSGFWTSSEGEELAYLPQPPESLEQGPNVAPPGGDHFWVPGMWVYNDYDYRWRPGYYTQSRGDYVWIPARYHWTPRGYVFCSGYWDYPLIRRGTLFSPVYFRQHRFPRRYRPRYTVAFEPLLIHLFARPRYNHYYFGDYYGNRYRDRGIIPFVSINTFGNRRYFHDPLFAYYHMPTRQNTFNRLVNWNRYFDRNTDLRPPRTLNATQQFAQANNRGQAGVKQAIVSVAIDELRGSNRGSGRAFRSISEETRNKISQDARESVRKLTESRVRFEARRNDENRGQNGILGQTDRPDQPGRPNLSERPDQSDRPDRSGKPDLTGRPDQNGRPDQSGRPDLSDRASRDDRANRLSSFRLPDTPKLQSRRDNLSSQQRDTLDRLRNQSGSGFDSSSADRSNRGPRNDSGQTRDLQIPNRGRSDSPSFDFNPRDNRGPSDRSLTPRSDMAPGFQRGGQSDRSSTPRSFSTPGNGPSPRSFTPRNLNAVPGSNSDAGRQRSFSIPDRSSSDRGSFNRSVPDRGSSNRSTPDRSPSIRSVPDRGSFSRSAPDRGSSIRSTPDRGSSSRSSSSRGSSSGSSDRGSPKSRGSGSKKK